MPWLCRVKPPQCWTDGDGRVPYEAPHVLSASRHNLSISYSCSSSANELNLTTRSYIYLYIYIRCCFGFRAYL